MLKMPSVEEMQDMARNHPEQLEQLQTDMNAELLRIAPEHMKKRIAGLLWKVDAERKRHSNPLARAMAVSVLMMESLRELNEVLNGIVDGRTPEESETAKILHFPLRGEDK